MGEPMPKGKPESNSDSADSVSVFDVVKIRELIELMQEHELSEVDLRESDQRIRLRRGGNDAPVVYSAPPAAASPTAAASSAPAAKDNADYIVSPTIGTFYSRPKPDAPDFVKVGDTVTPDTIVCLVEAMKMFNEIPAGVSGKIVECMAKNEEPVDNNKPLFKILPS
jgi:acetyl-CoA carboxylase biotin carboxyl carrier protein